MAKKVKDNNLIVPDIKGLELDIAGDILDDCNMKYEIQDKKVITFWCDKNCVGKTIPKRNKPLEKNQVIKIYPCKIKLGPPLILFIILASLLVYYINKHTITPFLFGAPEIEQTTSSWDNSKIIYVEDDADFNYSTVSYYEYCISKTKSNSDCNWKDTYTKSIRISDSGTWYVWFKGISEDYNESYLSNRLKVQVDNEAPIITSIDKTITKRSIEIRVNAKDSLSGISRYYYSINNQEFIEGSKSYTFNSLKEATNYDIKVRVVDKAGNMVDTTVTLYTLGSSNTNEIKTIPQISMIDVPSYITYKDNYYLPTNVNSNYSDYTICYDGTNKIDSTYDLSIGKHTITCTINIDSISVTSYKDITVVINQGEDEVLDEYVRVNLDYPKDAKMYMYRLNKDDVRLDEDKWTYYVEPLYIKREDVNNIIIKYDLDGEKIKSRDNLYIDINPTDYILNEGKETSVTINYSDKQDKVYYSVNNSTYIEYTGPFKVSGDSLINAYIIRKFKSYEEETNSIIDLELTKKDSVYIQKIYSPIGDKNNTNVSISLDNIPSVITQKNYYSIPSTYSYGVHGVDTLKCYANGEKVNSTSDLKDGEYNIICTITALDGESKSVNKHVIVRNDNYKYDLV